uniref:SMP-30/Gluconolactonase/LRE-like region domain-containing protein n=1 Tax=Amphimedon queenslandica TaxID=400682 RepID=A0A1X7UTW8_AMPQE
MNKIADPKVKPVSLSLSMEAPDSSLLCIPLSFLRSSLVGEGDEPIHTTVTTASTDPGVYRIQCNPSTSGSHTVKIQVDSVHLKDSFIPYIDLGSITPVHAIPECLRVYPWAVAVTDDNHVIVTECYDNCVTILDREGKKVKSLGEESGNVKFCFPRGIAFTPDKFILVSDSNRIQKISIDGYLVALVGEEGEGPLQFKMPTGLAISPETGKIYVADSGNCRIQVLNPDLTFSHAFGSKGSANGQFKAPHDIAIDSQGLVYVTEANCRIQKFSPSGEFVGQFDIEGSRPGQQKSSPYSIAIDTADTGLVYVTKEDSDRITVLDSEGVLKCSFGTAGERYYDSSLTSLAFDKDGLLYVCSFNGSLAIHRRIVQ